MRSNDAQAIRVIADGIDMSEEVTQLEIYHDMNGNMSCHVKPNKLNMCTLRIYYNDSLVWVSDDDVEGTPALPAAMKELA